MLSTKDLTPIELEMLYRQRTIGKFVGDAAMYDQVRKDADLVTHWDQMIRPKSVLDIGGGAGLLLYFMKHRYQKLYLLEKNCYEKEKRKTGSGDLNSFGGYNTFSMADKLLRPYLKENQTLTYIDADNYYTCRDKFDVICSWYSCGWHYPPETYLEWAISRLNVGGVVMMNLKQCFLGRMEKMESEYPVKYGQITQQYKDKSDVPVGILKKYK